MAKKFNITGTCIPEMHYMVDISGKLAEIFQLIENGEYFTINRPRQYGKTTTQFFLEKMLKKIDDYLVIRISFEGIGDEIFNNEDQFIKCFLEMLADEIAIVDRQLADMLASFILKVDTLKSASNVITEISKKAGKRIVLMIDEVDKSTNNQLFLSFLGILRTKYLMRNEGRDSTFHSVILAGVHDVKTLKLKIKPGSEQKFNSPWNIATDFKVDMSFNPAEISTMLTDYVNDKKIKMDIHAISERIYHYTSGYPFLVSKVCKEIDENLLPSKTSKEWNKSDIDEAVKIITIESNTNFSSLTKNIENDNLLYDFIINLILGKKEYLFMLDVPLINNAYTHGIINNVGGKVKIHNKIYEEYLTNYIIIKIKTENDEIGRDFDIVQSSYVKSDGRLNIEKVFLKFQEVIKEKYSKSDLLKSNEFLEKELRMLFLVFLKPIINGIGFSFKEVETSEEKRLDIIIIFRDEKFIVELKIWRGEEYHEQGIGRLKDYMKREGVKKGYMLIMDKRRSKAFVTYIEEEITMVWI